MNSSMIGKIAKAKQYAKEPDRAQFNDFSCQFHGENDTHTVSFKAGAWHCGCDFFANWKTCCHTMALERILSAMIAPEYRQGGPIFEEPSRHSPESRTVQG